jgi:hypothetical protein
MEANIEAGLVRSYEFSNYERIVYVDQEVWGFFPVKDKKDFLEITDRMRYWPK